MALNDWELWPAKTTRIVIEVDGYRWRVHGAKDKLRWRSHLVELLGAERLDVPLDRGLMKKMREAVAKRLDLEVEVVAAISADLILA